MIQFRKESFRQVLEEVSNCKGNQLTFDTNQNTFAEVLRTPKKTAKEAFREKASKFCKVFVFGKLSIQIQKTISTVGKTNASAKVIRACNQRSLQYQQLILQQTRKLLLNEISSRHKRPEHGNKAPAINYHQEFNGDCHDCGKEGKSLQQGEKERERQ